MAEAKRWMGEEQEPSPLRSSSVAHHLAVATWMITKPLMSENWGLTKSTCSCLTPLLEGVMLNWTKALSWGSRLGTLGKGKRKKAEKQTDHQPSPIPELACQSLALQKPQDWGHASSFSIAHLIRKAALPLTPTLPRLALTWCWAVPGEGHCPPPSAYSLLLSPRGGWPPSLPLQLLPPLWPGPAPGGAIPKKSSLLILISPGKPMVLVGQRMGQNHLYPLLSHTQFPSSIIISIPLHPCHFSYPWELKPEPKATAPPPALPTSDFLPQLGQEQGGGCGQGSPWWWWSPLE